MMTMMNNSITGIKMERNRVSHYYTKTTTIQRCSLLLLLLLLLPLESSSTLVAADDASVAATAPPSLKSASWLELDSSSSSSCCFFWTASSSSSSKRQDQGTRAPKRVLSSMSYCSLLQPLTYHAAVDMVSLQKQRIQQRLPLCLVSFSKNMNTIIFGIRGGAGDDDHHHQELLLHGDAVGRSSNNSQEELLEPQLLLHRNNADSHGYKILKQEIIYNYWRKLIRRVVQYPPPPTSIEDHHQQQQQQQYPSLVVADFEIISQGDHGGTVSDEAVLIFVWNRSTKTATLIQEYMPSNHQLVCGLAAGMVEKKHTLSLLPQQPTSNSTSDDDDDLNADNNNFSQHDLERQQRRIAAEHELEEECQLQGGEWFILCEPTTLDKYTTTRLSVFLVIDPYPINENGNVKQRDVTEQGMIIIPGVSISQLLTMMTSGQMTVVGSWGTLLALHKLRILQEIQ